MNHPNNNNSNTDKFTSKKMAVAMKIETSFSPLILGTWNELKTIYMLHLIFLIILFKFPKLNMRIFIVGNLGNKGKLLGFQKKKKKLT